MAVTWHRPAPKESWKQLHERLLAERPAFGLLLGSREIGLRTAPTAGATPFRTWQIAGTPPQWTDDFVRELLVAQTTLQEPTIIRRLVRIGKCIWWLRASAGTGADAQQIVVEEPEGPGSFWVLPSVARTVRRIAFKVAQQVTHLVTLRRTQRTQYS